MRKIVLFATIILIALASSCSANSSSNDLAQAGVIVPDYKLFETKNIWIFLKLDTRYGTVDMIQYSMEDNNRLEIPIDYGKLASGKDALPGRFTLYPTQNMWNFILLDQMDGRTWQVQWSTDGHEGIVPINDKPTKRTE